MGLQCSQTSGCIFFSPEFFCLPLSLSRNPTWPDGLSVPKSKENPYLGSNSHTPRKKQPPGFTHEWNSSWERDWAHIPQFSWIPSSWLAGKSFIPWDTLPVKGGNGFQEYPNDLRRRRRRKVGAGSQFFSASLGEFREICPSQEPSPRFSLVFPGKWLLGAVGEWRLPRSQVCSKSNCSWN